VNFSVIGTLENLAEEAMRYAVSTIVVSLDDACGWMPVTGLLRCRLEGIRVVEVTTLVEEMTGCIVFKGLRFSWLVFSDGFSRLRFHYYSKRVAETAAAIAMFTLAAFLFGLFAFLVRLISPGPILFRQERVGERPPLFWFRTMRVDAEAKSGPVWRWKRTCASPRSGGSEDAPRRAAAAVERDPKSDEPGRTSSGAAALRR
jgi:hypothetical protein